MLNLLFCLQYVRTVNTHLNFVEVDEILKRSASSLLGCKSAQRQSNSYECNIFELIMKFSFGSSKIIEGYIDIEN